MADLTVDPNCLIVGSRIRKLRLARGITMYEMEDRTPMSRTTIWKQERGDRALRLTQVLHYAKALGCSPHDLLCGIEWVRKDSNQ